MARVLLPVDDEKEHARRVCTLAAELFPGGTFVLLHVINPSDAGYSPEATLPSVAQEWYENRESTAEELFDDLETHISEETDGASITVERRIEVGQPGRTIVEQIEHGSFDHVVMGSHGRRGISRLLLGSVAETVVRRSPVPVTVAQ
jgi:nucleotide-binding universal stress UspA family protein